MGINSNNIKLFILLHILLLNSCILQKQDPKKDSFIPKKNKIYLVNNDESQVKPRSRVQTGYLNGKENNKQAPIKLYDEVSNNNIAKLKRSFIEQNNKSKTTNKPAQTKMRTVARQEEITQQNNSNVSKKHKKNFFIQIGAYSNRQNAENVERKLSLNFKKVFSEKKSKNNINLTKIKLGPYHSLSEAKDILNKLKLDGFKSSIIISEK